MLTEIWFKAEEKSLRLPVVPPEFEIITSASYSDSTVLSLGDVAIYTANGLAKIAFTSFFPNKEYSFNAYSNVPKPYDLINIINEWKNKGTIVRVICTGTNINLEMRITDFNYGEKDGTGDVYYSIDFVEHRQIVIPRIAVEESNPNSNNENRPSPPPPPTQRTHKVVKGDSLWAIAQKYYGKGSRYPEIKKANQSKYTCLKKSNVIYPYMTLVIP